MNYVDLNIIIEILMEFLLQVCHKVSPNDAVSNYRGKNKRAAKRVHMICHFLIKNFGDIGHDVTHASVGHRNLITQWYDKSG